MMRLHFFFVSFQFWFCWFGIGDLLCLILFIACDWIHCVVYESKNDIAVDSDCVSPENGDLCCDSSGEFQVWEKDCLNYFRTNPNGLFGCMCYLCFVLLSVVFYIIVFAFVINFTLFAALSQRFQSNIRYLCHLALCCLANSPNMSRCTV